MKAKNTLTGPEDLSYAEMAAIMTEASGRQIHHVDVPPKPRAKEC